MNVPRTHDSSRDFAVQPTVSTLHIPVTSTFIPFHQLSLTDGSTLRNPADDNNNKTAVPVVSVVTAVSGLCPTISVVSMQQPAQLAQTMVASTIIPTVVTPISVQTANCIAPTTTMTVSNTINISNHLSVPPSQQPPFGNPGLNITPQTGGILSNNILNASSNNTNSAHQIVPASATSNTGCGNNSTASQPSNSMSAKSINTANTSTSVKSNSTSNNSTSAKSNSTNSKTASSTSNQGATTEQLDELVKPVFKDGELVLEVECGQNKAILFLSKLCQGSKGPCISFQSSWLTPNEFQFVSGRETAKDWKRSIRHHGKSLKLLLAKGILNVHPTMCDCDGCRQGATLTRKGEKRRIPNGERKPRKPSSNNTGNGSSMDGNSIRSASSSLMAVPLGSAGNAPAKPELMRSACDKSKMADTANQSHQSETTVSLYKATPVHRPDSLKTSKDISKQKIVSTNAASAPSSPLVPGTAADLSPTTPAQLSSASIFNTVLGLNSSSAPSTPSVAHPFSPFVSVASSTSSVSYAAQNPATTATLVSLQESQNSIMTTSETTPPSANPEFPTRHPSSTAEMTQMLSPKLPSSTPLLTTVSFNRSDSIQLPDHKVDISDHFKRVSESSVEDSINVGNETDESFSTDERSDDFDSESAEEHSDDSSRVLEESDFTPDDHQPMTSPNKPPTDLKKTTAYQTDKILASLQYSHLESVNSLRASGCETKQTPGNQELPTHPETAMPGPNIKDIRDSFTHTESPLSPTSLSSTTTLAVSSMSRTCSTPVSLSISTANVKSEHIWVPPTLSPPTDGRHFNPVKHDSPGAKSPTNATPQQSNAQFLEGYGSTPHKDRNRYHIFAKAERSSYNTEFGPASQKSKHTFSAMTPLSKEFDLMDRQLTHTVQMKEAEAVKKDNSDPGHAKAHHLAAGASSELRDKEREDRHRQKVKDDKNRKEREERNRKDRERDERRERERREEKEAERMRQEEKDRKSQAESKSNKERSTATPSSDPSRRPPGGLAEAAAFSDYMRVLAAGHGHTYMSPTPGYMSSLFPIRPQESPLPAHLLHPMSAFGPHLSNIHKDSLMYQTTTGVLPNFGGPSFRPLQQPLLQRHQYTTQQSVLDYQRSLAALSSCPWPAAYPYFLHDMSASAPSSTAAGKRAATELEATMDLNAKRMRLEGRQPDYSSTWDYFAAVAAASQQMRLPAMAPSLPCGLESTSMDKTAEYLRRRYLEYGPHAATYISALPEYARLPYHCTCADHRDEDIRMWNVEDVCKFITTIEGCAVYTEHFREQRVNGHILSLLTTDHLVKTMGMKFGPAVTLFEAVAKKVQDIGKMSNCDACRNIALSQPLHPMVLPL